MFFLIFNEKLEMFTLNISYFYFAVLTKRRQENFFLPFSVCKSVWVLDTDTLWNLNKGDTIFFLSTSTRLLFDGSTLKAGS